MTAGFPSRHCLRMDFACFRRNSRLRDLDILRPPFVPVSARRVRRFVVLVNVGSGGKLPFRGRGAPCAQLSTVSQRHGLHCGRERVNSGNRPRINHLRRGLMAKRSFWVLSKQPREIGGFGKRPVPAQFKTVEEASKYCKELNLKRGAY